jgi:hypothetical protein
VSVGTAANPTLRESKQAKACIASYDFLQHSMTAAANEMLPG